MNGIAVAYDASSDRYYVDVPVDGSHGVGKAIVFAIGEILDQDPVSLQPLGEVVDTDSLTAIFCSAEESERDLSITFDYSGFEVTVRSSGRITFEEIH